MFLYSLLHGKSWNIRNSFAEIVFSPLTLFPCSYNDKTALQSDFLSEAGCVEAVDINYRKSVNNPIYPTNENTDIFREVYVQFLLSCYTTFGQVDWLDQSYDCFIDSKLLPKSIQYLSEIRKFIVFVF